MSERKRLLTELRVIDLRVELEKRNLDKTGVRGVLVQRLSTHLESEGHDPATYKFELSSPDVKTPAKRKRNQSSIEPESEETPAMEDMIVQDDVADEEDLDHQNDQCDITKNDDEQQIEDTSVQGDNANSRKRELKDEIESSSPKKPCIKEDDKAMENNDAEDSINLDLGEDELLNEESDNIKSKKDDVGDDDDGVADKSGACDNQPGDNGDVENSTNEEETQGDTSHDAASSQNNESANDKDSKDNKDDNDKKDKKDDSKEGGARNLWVSGLSGDTRAKDLKQLCTKYGKVIGAKVVTNARTPGSRCYGYVTMATSQDAENCIKNLHRTELHGRMISVEKAKSESDATSRRMNSRNDRSSKERKDKESDNKDDGKNNTSKEEDGKSKKADDSTTEGENKTSKSRERSRVDNKDKNRRSTRSRERRKSPRDVLSFSKIWKEREQARARSRARVQREEERRRRQAEEALRERERRQRQEKQRLQHERDKLRQERERIEREKNELLRLERERHRLEREKLELERLELKRAQLRLEEERRKRGYEGASYRKPSPTGFDLRDVRDPRAKRPPPVGMGSSRAGFDAPPPPRFEVSNASYDREKRDRDYKRDYPRHMPPAAPIKYPTNGNNADDARQPPATGNRPKEPSRSYDSRDNRSYRPSPPGKPDARTWNASTRYPDNSASNKGDRVARPSEKYSSSTSGAPSGDWSSASNSYVPPYDQQRYSQYQPPPPGAYPDRYPAQREYRKY